MNNMQQSNPVKTSRKLLTTHYPVLLLVFFCSVFLVQCKKNSTTFSSSAKLMFSTKQLFFDTVFSTIGSSVRVFIVHNNNNEAVNISSVNLAGYYPSYFKINIDGTPGSNFTNIKIPANDSIYVFATVTVNPTNQNSPLVIQDSLVFTTNGNVQSVQLLAFGQDAYFYVPNVFPPSGPAYYNVKCGDVWSNDKPHVIFGYLNVSTGCTLTITKGTQVYLHDSAVILIDSAATLNVTGQSGSPVTFQQDRLEPDYKYIPGQWNGVLLYKSVNCNISWAVLQNGTTGIQVDTVAPTSSNPALKMDHTIIKGMSGYGLLGEGAPVTVNNSVIADCQYGCVAMVYGGTYHYYQCTFADYWGVDNSFGQRTNPVVYMNNGYQAFNGQNIPRPLDSAIFRNCIIYGALDEEVGLDSSFNAPFNYYFGNCVLKTKHTTSPGSHYSNSNWVNIDPMFYNPGIDDYHVYNGSPALGNADPAICKLYSPNLDGNSRLSAPYNIGAY
jgi:hypothetical protein